MTNIILNLKNLTIPEKDLFEELGFLIKKQENNNTFEVQLPQKWDIIPETLLNWYTIYDENKYPRAEVFSDNENNKQKATMFLTTRYRIIKTINNKYCTLALIDVQNNDTIVSIDFTEDIEKEKRYKENIQDFANKNYPDWKNPMAYWENQKQKILTIQQ